jgi:5-methyltetrahydropteroyltriglutamate--homocysteine methyltransferase
MAPTHRTHPPYRAEHIGSLLRPESLRKAHREHAEGRIDAAAFRAEQDRAVREVVALQESLGFRAVTDGEFRRVSYWAHFVEATDGLEVETARFDFHDDQDRVTHFLAPRIAGPVRRGRSISGDEFDFLRSVATATPKLTMPSPPTMHFWGRSGAARAAGYADEEAFFADLARVYREEIADLCARGATYLQLDEVPLAMLCDPALRARVQADGDDPDALVRRYVELFNSCLAGRPDSLTVGVHLCRGNFKGQWLSEGGYQTVAERMFNEIAVDAFFLEYDTPRAGDFAPLAAVPATKSVVLGLVSSKTPVLEDPDALVRRVEEAGRHIDVARLAVSPQCGFASTVAGNPVTLDTERAKLALVQEVARRVWG